MRLKMIRMTSHKFLDARNTPQDNVWVSVATAIAGVFAIFANEIDKITEQLEDVDKAKS